MSTTEIAAFVYTDQLVTSRIQRWDEDGKLLEDFSMRTDTPTFAKLEQNRKRRPYPVVDIDLKTLTFFERPADWGRDLAALPPPQAAPSLELCRLLEAQTSIKH